MVKHEDERAFPVTVEDGHGESMTNLGMSLRDYFAAKAAVGLMGRSWNNITGTELIALWATSAYAMADAMLAERAK